MIAGVPDSLESRAGEAQASAAQIMSRPVIRMLLFTRESFPTFRPDVEVLFGRELLSRGHKIDLVMQAEREAEPTGPRSWHGRTVWVGATDSGNNFLHRLLRQCLALWHDVRSLAHVRAQNYDAVQVRDKFLIAAALVFTARRRGLKFFYWLSFPEPESELLRARERTARYPAMSFIRGVVFGWLLYRWILPRCDHAFVQSEQMRRDLAAHGIDQRKLTPVPMGIAASDVQAPLPAVRPDQHLRASILTLAYVGTLNSQRRLEVLVDMLAALLQSGLVTRLLLVGGGSHEADDRARLERRATQLGVLEHMEITGFLPREAALARVRSADIGLSPYFPTPVLRSTSPTKLVEYLALGLPVVANSHPEQRRVLRDSGAGISVPWGARYFARGVAWLAGRTPAERYRMGEGGRQWVLAHRTYGRIADELERKYLELLQGRATATATRRATVEPRTPK
jgi:glycosyltransferase involved in cell wall biosynthesis